MTSRTGGNGRLTPSRLGPRDVLRLGGAGVRTRPQRAALSALGIAIGIAAMIAVVGISASSRAELDARLTSLGTNMLTVTAGNTLFGEQAKLPKESPGMVARIGPVTGVSAVGDTNAHVYRNNRIPSPETSGIAVRAARTNLLATVSASVGHGRWLDNATARYPTVVLGATAARRLGIGSVTPGLQVWLGDQWFTVIGILDPVDLAPELDSSALVGWPSAQSRLGFNGYPSTLYERSRDDAVEDVRRVLAATVNPAHPEEVSVSRPSDALAARAAANAAFTGLLLGLGGVALLVGGIGVANTMVIGVLERRGEIGLRRALGATKGQIRSQFLAESVILAGLGGIAGAMLGAVLTAGYATTRGWPLDIPLWVLAGAAGATVVIGAVAGLYPAMRAARLSPTVALTTP